MRFATLTAAVTLAAALTSAASAQMPMAPMSMGAMPMGDYSSIQPAVAFDDMPGAVQPVSWNGDSCGACMYESADCGCSAPMCGDVCCPAFGKEYFTDRFDTYPGGGRSWLLDAACCVPWRDGWTIDSGFVYLNRHPSGRNDVTIIENGGTATLWDERQQELGWSAGPRIEVTKQLDCRGEWFANVVYFDVDSWEFNRRLANFECTTRGSTYNAAAGSVFSSAKLYNVELNVMRKFTQRLTYLMGYRWMEASDELVITSDGVGRNLYRGMNQLNGFQVGLLGDDLYNWRRLHLSGGVKAGVFSNRGSNDRYEETVGAANPRACHILRDTAFVGEVHGNIEWRPCRWMKGYFGYEALWMDSAVLAANQVESNSVDFGDTAFYQGIRTGLICNW